MLKKHLNWIAKAVFYVGGVGFVCFGIFSLIYSWDTMGLPTKILFSSGALFVSLKELGFILSKLRKPSPKEAARRLAYFIGMTRTEYEKAEKVSASIRNKLSPPKNLAFLIEQMFGTSDNPKDPDLDKIKTLIPFLRKEAENTATNVGVLSEMADRYCSMIPVDEKYSQ